MDKKQILWCVFGAFVFSAINTLLIYGAVQLKIKNTIKCELSREVQVTTLQTVFTGLIDGVPKYTYVPSETIQKVCVKYKDKT